MHTARIFVTDLKKYMWSLLFWSWGRRISKPYALEQAGIKVNHIESQGWTLSFALGFRNDNIGSFTYDGFRIFAYVQTPFISLEIFPPSCRHVIGIALGNLYDWIVLQNYRQPPAAEIPVAHKVYAVTPSKRWHFAFSKTPLCDLWICPEEGEYPHSVRIHTAGKPGC